MPETSKDLWPWQLKSIEENSNNQFYLVDDSLNDSFYSNNKIHPNGDLWISPDRLILHWCLTSSIKKTFNFKKPIIKANFVDFENVKNCLVIVLKDKLIIYFLNTGDNLNVCLPFPISNTFFYSKGLIFERDFFYNNNLTNLNDEVFHKFFILNDPMSQFGSIDLNFNKSVLNNYHFINNLQLLLVPSSNSFNITIFYDFLSNEIIFCNTKLFNSKNSNSQFNLNSFTSSNNNHNNNLTFSSSYKDLNLKFLKNLDITSSNTSPNSNNNTKDIKYFKNSSRISSNLQKRTNSTIWQNSPIFNTSSEINNDNNLLYDEYSILSPKSRRIISNNNPTTIKSSNLLQLDYNSNSKFNGISTKDINLIKITSIKLQIPSNSKAQLKCIPLIFKNNEAIIVFDKALQFCKICIFNSDSLASHNQFFNESLQNDEHVIFKDLPAFTGKDNSPIFIKNILNYHCDQLPGVIALNYSFSTNQDTEDLWMLYNPFLDIQSPASSLTQEITSGLEKDIVDISSNRILFNRFHLDDSQDSRELYNDIPLYATSFPFPTKGVVLNYFNALKYIVPSDIYFPLIFLWQAIVTEKISQIPRKLQQNAKFRIQSESFFELLIYLISPTSMPNNWGSHILFSSTFTYIFNSQRALYVPKILMGLHLLREEFKLNALLRSEVTQLGEILHTCIKHLGWSKFWLEYYSEYNFSTTFNNYCISVNELFTKPLDEPPEILKSLYSITQTSNIQLTPFISFSRLVEQNFEVDGDITPRTSKLLKLYELFYSENNIFSNDCVLNYLTNWKIDKFEIETYPFGIMLPLNVLLDKLEKKLLQVDINDNIDLSLIARHDLNVHIQIVRSLLKERSKIHGQNKNNILGSPTSAITLNNSHMEITNSSKQYFRILNKFMSLGNNKYLQKPTDIYSLAKEIIKRSDSNSNVDGLPDDDVDIDEGKYLKRNRLLIFSQDRRFYDALKILQFSKPTVVTFISKSREYTKLLKRKKKFASVFALRKCTAGLGWGAIAFASEKPLATQKWPHQSLSLVFKFPDNTKIKLEAANIGNDYYNWGEFHAGVSSGLKISKKATNIDGSWISFNKPKEVDANHGGFLLGLGLNGHLRNLEEWHVYNYLSVKKKHVSIGLLLGMSASLLGSMDLKLTKVLSVHIVALLPPGSSDLNIDLRVQTAGLIGIGILYQGSSHKRMSKIAFDQLSSLVVVKGEQTADEGYRIAAGVALGLINLGKGKRYVSKSKSKAYQRRRNSTLSFPGFKVNQILLSGTEEDSMNYIPYSDDEASTDDDSLTDMLNKDPGFDDGLVKDLLEILLEEHDVEKDWIPDYSQIGTTITLLLIHLKSRDKDIASKIRQIFSVSPNTTLHCKPEVFMYREFAFHMILWDTVMPQLDFILEGIEPGLIKNINSDNLPIYYTIAGRILAMGIRFASSSDFAVRDILIKIADTFIPFYQIEGNGTVDFRMTIIGINMIVNVLIVSLGLVMCGTGDLATFRRIRYLSEIVTGSLSDLYFENTMKSKADENDDAEMVDINTIEENESDSGSTESSNDNSEELGEGNNSSNDNNEKEEFKDKEYHYGKYMATNLAVGFLFLGSGQYALKNSDLKSIAYLILSVLPVYMPTYPSQELKHFWSLAAEPRCLVLKDVMSGELINSVPVKIAIIREDKNIIDEKTYYPPCLLPDIRNIAYMKVEVEDFYPLYIEFNDNLKAIDYFKNGTILYVQSKISKQTFEGSILKTNQKKLENILSDKYQEISDNMRSEKDDPSLFHKISKDIHEEELILMELNDELNEVSNNKKRNYNLDLLCQNKSLEATNSVRLELWKKSHSK